MTRLTEALERARLVTPSGSDAASSPVADTVLRTWRFDVEPNTPPVAVRREPQPRSVPDVHLHVPDEVREKLVTAGIGDAALAEQYRRVAAALHHAQNERGLRSVMVASAVAAEGKTLTATNVALTLSISLNRRVLLVDADLRRPSIHTMFGLDHRQGLIDVLANPLGGRLPVSTVAKNLWVLPAGRPTADPMGNLVSGTMKQLLADATSQFDWVIVDTPPVALMPDANLLAAMIDGALLVISANTTPYPLAQKAVAAIGPQRVLGIILNRADRGAVADEYGYYGYYNRPPAASAPKRFRWFSK